MHIWSKTESDNEQERILSDRTRLFLIILGSISLLALVLRIILCFELRRIPSVTAPWAGTDMATYDKLADEILKGNWPGAFYYQPFYYSVFLPFFRFVFGHSPWVTMLVQAILGSLTVWFTGLTAAKLYSRRAGLAAAGLLTLSRFHIFYTPFLLIAVLQSFWISLLMWMGIRAYDRNTLCRWLILGGVAGMAILTRGNLLLFLPGIVLVLLWRNRRSRKRSILWAVLLLFACYLPQLPFAVQNFRHHGRWTGPSTARDTVLALGSTPQAPPGGLEYPPAYKTWLSRANGKDSPTGKRTPILFQILEWMKDEPLAYPELKLRTFLLFWNKKEIPNNVSFSNEGRYSRLLHSPLLLGFAVVGSLGLTGLLLCFRLRSPKALLLYFCLAAYCAGTILFYMLARFRIPALPLICIFGGAGVNELSRRWQNREKTSGQLPLLRALLVLALSLLFVMKGFDTYQESVGKMLVRLARPHGVRVHTRKGMLIHDHGTRSCGGWEFTPELPSAGVTMHKDFSLSGIPPEKLSHSAVLRLAVSGNAGDRIRIEVTAPDSEKRSTACSLPKGNMVKWIEAPCGSVTPGKKILNLQIRLVPLSGKICLVLDRYRDYGRTRLSRGGHPVSPGAEAVAEITLLLPE